MWARLDDKLARHPKLLDAAARLRAESQRTLAPFAHGRCLSTVVEVFLYCSAYGTNGFFPAAAASELSDPEASAVLAHLVACRAPGSTRGFLIQADGGWQVHDFDDYNPDAADVKERRKRDAERKREERARRREATQALATVPEIELSLSRVVDVHISVHQTSTRTSVGRPVDASDQHPADVARTVGAASTVCPQASRARDPVPSRPLEKPEEPRAAQAPRARLPRAYREVHEVQTHLHAAVHGFLEAGPPYVDAAGAPQLSELTAALEQLAVRQLDTVSPDSRDISAIVDAVVARRQARITAATRRDRRDRAALRRLRRIG